MLLCLCKDCRYIITFQEILIVHTLYTHRDAVVRVHMGAGFSTHSERGDAQLCEDTRHKWLLLIIEAKIFSKLVEKFF